MIGRTLAHYEILEKLGQGGMGEVYLAVDRKLDRRIALKVLPAELAEDPEVIDRFAREAKAVAALNHPNIVTLHSVEQADGVHFLTMELVDGESLGEQIPEGGLPLDRFFDLALPLAGAVAAAHDKGVTHRDLKPANIMVGRDGLLKVLDFGLAKLLDAGEDEVTMAAPAEALTREGLVVGTVPYMSPEQVQGEPVDRRSDVFSLGIILYQLLAGRRPFAGKNSAATISALLRDAPRSLEELRPDVPHHLERVIRRCLEKDPDRRYRSARDVAIELENLEREARGADAPVARGGRSGTVAKLALPVVVAMVIGTLVLVWLSRRAEGPETTRHAPPRLVKLTGAAGLEDDPAWSPDGKFLAYTTDERGSLDIVIQPMGGGRLIRAFASEADEALPAWSPDGRQIAFVSAADRTGRLTTGINLGPLTGFILARGGDLFVAPALGGTPLKLAEDAYAPSWSPDGGRIAFSTPGRDGYEIWTVGVDGDEPRRVAAAVGMCVQPAWSPDGSRIAYGLARLNAFGFDLHVVPASGGPPIKLGLPVGIAVMHPSWSSDGRYLYFSSDLGGRYNIWRAPAPTADSAAFGKPEQITFGGGSDVSASVSATDGALAFSTVNINVGLWEHDLESGVSRQLTHETGYEGNPRAAPDGEVLLLTTDRGGEPEVWTYGTEGDPISRIGATVALDSGGTGSPDSRYFAYARGGDERATLVFKAPDSMSETELLDGGFGPDWSPDGGEIAVAVPNDSGNAAITVISVEEGTSRSLTDGESADNFPSWSPDGRELVFQRTGDRGTRTIYRLAAAGGEPRAITSGELEDSHPRWSPTDPDSVLFLRNHTTIVILSLSTGAEREIDADLPPQFGLDYPSWSADGKKIYFSLATKTGDIYVTEE